MAKPRRPKHYDRPGYRPGPEAKGSYADQKGAADERQQKEDLRWPPLDPDGVSKMVGRVRIA